MATDVDEGFFPGDGRNHPAMVLTAGHVFVGLEATTMEIWATGGPMTLPLTTGHRALHPGRPAPPFTGIDGAYVDPVMATPKRS